MMGTPLHSLGCGMRCGNASRRTGAFEMLILHNAAMLSNLMIATEDVSNIPFVTGVISDPDLDTYTYENPSRRRSAIRSYKRG